MHVCSPLSNSFDYAFRCPPERNALKTFYESTKGVEWTNTENWMREYLPHCYWHGVSCDKDDRLIELDLRHNGLSGTLSDLSNLSSLEVLDLSDNDIKGEIPTSIGLLNNLTRLRLSYNSFQGNETNLDNLTKLQLVHLHSNRISGTIPVLHGGHSLPGGNVSSFVADCGVPSRFDEALVCTQCSTCCNSLEQCIPTEETTIQRLGFEDYKHFTWVFFLLVFGTSLVLATTLYCFERHKHRGETRNVRRQSMINRDSKYAFESIGVNSVYSFFLGKSWPGWLISIITIALQVWMLYQFVRASEFDVSDDDYR